MSPFFRYLRCLLYTSLVLQAQSYRVLESLTAKSNAKIKTNQQQFSKMMPPLPANTWTQPLLELKVRHLNHPLWYDDHNPTARKVTYLDDKDAYGSETSLRFFALSDDWNVIEPYPPQGGRYHSLTKAWRRLKKWRR